MGTLSREIIKYKDYFDTFFQGLPLQVQNKIDYVLYILRHTQQVPEKFLKHIEGTKGLYEIRVEVSGNIYRIFCFFDAGRLVILANGFQKKTNKTPKEEITLAKKLMQEYFQENK